MKNIKLFTVVYVTFFMLFFTTAVFAQNSLDLSGTFEGIRKQYNTAHTDFMQEFQYKYELKQEGDVITGTSTIINERGDYAVTQLRGYVVGTIFYFEEFRIDDEMKDPFSVWCFKKGSLSIKTTDGKITLEGNTESYTSNYGKACTGGFTQISKTDSKYTNETQDKSNLSSNLNVTVSPNPTADMAQISFENNSRQKALIEVYDLAGKRVQLITNKTLDKGFQNFSFSLGTYGNGLYIVKLSLGETVYSTSIIKAAN